MRSKIRILDEHGLDHALLGLSLNKNQPVEDMLKVANNLAYKDGGHNKFLEAIVVWLDLTMPRFFWQEFDTYRIGMTKQSESTMHTLLKRDEFVQDLFDVDIPQYHIYELNQLLDNHLNNNDSTDTEALIKLKRRIPEDWLQRRICCTNYKVLRHIYQQRHKHRVPHWQQLCSLLITDLANGQWLKRNKE